MERQILSSHIGSKRAEKPKQLALDDIKFAQGMGPALRFANEIRAVQQVSRLPALKSSNLHEDVLTGRLGAGTGLQHIYDDLEK